MTLQMQLALHDFVVVVARAVLHWIKETESAHARVCARAARVCAEEEECCHVLRVKCVLPVALALLKRKRFRERESARAQM